ncbi:MAG: peptidoglycan-binding protein, partial [Clostridia bacterium]|nr:peptidoglycan-binding protein [Clostridia bacterium]MDD4665623.1 peptidoglycan-binding protein [Clostridia bacterium]
MQYVVQAGDTLSSIAQKFGTTVEAIVRANNLADPNLIFVGQVLTIPGVAVPPTPPVIPVPPTPPVSGLCPRLQRGSRGPSVRTLQTLLRSAGANPGVVDGVFGARTEAAVRLIQTRRGLPVTGIVDVQTWETLGVSCGVTPPPGPPVPPVPPVPPQEYFCPVLRLGDRGPAVRFLQTLLRDKGFYTGPIDGVFDVRTQRAVRQFQRQQGLAVTGVVRNLTWRALGVTCVQVPTPPQGTPIATRVGRGIRHILFTDKRVYNRGENIKITLVKTNVTDEEINLRYRTSQIVEITATNAAGVVVWRYSTGRTFAQFTRLITIFPGGTQVIERTWNQVNNSGRQVPSGTYTITETNLATNISLSVQV